MRLALTPAEFIRVVLLMAVRDGADLIRIQIGEGAWHALGRADRYRQDYRVGSVWYELMPPWDELVQSLPAALSACRPLRKRLLAPLARTYRRFKSGSMQANFDFAVGEQFLVEIKFQVNWRNRVVSTIELAISDSGVLEEIAQHVWQSKYPDDGID